MRVLFLCFAFALHLSLCLLGRFVVVHSNRFPYCCRLLLQLWLMMSPYLVIPGVCCHAGLLLDLICYV